VPDTGGSLPGFQTDNGAQACCILDKSVVALELLNAVTQCNSATHLYSSSRLTAMDAQLQSCCSVTLFEKDGSSSSCLAAVSKPSQYFHAHVVGNVSDCLKSIAELTDGDFGLMLHIGITLIWFLRRSSFNLPRTLLRGSGRPNQL
jgi:hypothetical protein